MAGFAGASPTGAGAMLRLIRDGRARTHAELVALTGLSRSTVAQRVDSLLTRRLVVPAEPGASRGGRAPQNLSLHPPPGGGGGGRPRAAPPPPAGAAPGRR